MQHLANEIDFEHYRGRFGVKKIIRLAYINESPDWKLLLHRHNDHCEIIYIESGRGDYTVDQTLYSIKAGDVILINSGVGHVQISDPADPIVSWNLAIQTCRTERLPENHLIPDDVIPIFHAGERETLIKTFFHQIYSEALNKPSGFESAVLLYAELLRTSVLRLSSTSETHLQPRIHSLPEQIKGYIDDHYNEKLSLDTIADIFYINKYHIVHVMKKAYGISPIDYMVSRRMGEAQNLLNTTSLSVEEISGIVGYRDKNYFSRIFKKKVGISPLEFRNRYQTI